ncbi:8-amino-7-oxononanoate synthase [Silvimonas iriomotensis]|uniref:8-amino-7-oxononanoate synthase n=1 Tax=Silvimonas iriomotensis TaxID=449662 RepID=A0ABQ2PDI7_9NEIS|nr:8-amino-7-oxononanoate synthase [Silvimonas iriomotensis]GGP23391.1 8-amino-7-oxononanoate synthase [Silvimonas iriomotensis]
MTNPFQQLEADLAERRAAHLYRRRPVVSTPQGPTVVVDGVTLTSFCSNDYLGLAAHPGLVAAAQAGAARWGVGSGASHLVCGHQAAHEDCERKLAAFVGKPAALTLATGYLANLAVITALVGREDAVFADKLNHASLNDACLLSRATFKRYAHNDLDMLERQLADTPARRKLIVADAVFSMDGDTAPLAGLLALAERHDAWLFIDDAHGFGVLGEGRGSMAECGLDSPRIIYMATLGKAAGVAGAFVAAEEIVIDYLVNMARPYIYTTAAPALIAEAVSASVDVIADEAWRRERLQDHIRLLRDRLAAGGCQLMPSATAIQPLEMPSSEAALALSAALRQRGHWVAAIRPPTVPTPRLRITLSAAHDTAAVQQLADDLIALLPTLSSPRSLS